jgi:hypothetical protein
MNKSVKISPDIQNESIPQFHRAFKNKRAWVAMKAIPTEYFGNEGVAMSQQWKLVLDDAESWLDISLLSNVLALSTKDGLEFRIIDGITGTFTAAS